MNTLGSKFVLPVIAASVLGGCVAAGRNVVADDVPTTREDMTISLDNVNFPWGKSREGDDAAVLLLSSEIMDGTLERVNGCVKTLQAAGMAERNVRGRCTDEETDRLEVIDRKMERNGVPERIRGRIWVKVGEIIKAVTTRLK